MQFRLSTLFLIFFMVAASLALLGTWGVWIAAVMLFSALLFNKFYMKDAIVCVSLLIFFGIIFPVFFLPAFSSSGEPARRAACINNLRQIGYALQNYHITNKHLPTANICDVHGKPLFSWRLELLLNKLPILYQGIKNDEPWNSPYNIRFLDQLSDSMYKCIGNRISETDKTTNYIAIIGPGTAWRKDGPVKFSDLPDGGSHTIMVLEVANSGVYWAEPRDLTVEEALEGLKTGEGLRISSPHPYLINILFADESVRTLPSKMPISVWKKLLAGEITDLDNIEKTIDPSAPDMVDVSVLPARPGKWAIILSTSVWLLSVALLFRRAIKSRRKPEPQLQNPQIA
jgi:Protein of unknown function (DUF1559)